MANEALGKRKKKEIRPASSASVFFRHYKVNKRHRVPFDVTHPSLKGAFDTALSRGRKKIKHNKKKKIQRTFTCTWKLTQTCTLHRWDQPLLSTNTDLSPTPETSSLGKNKKNKKINLRCGTVHMQNHRVALFQAVQMERKAVKTLETWLIKPPDIQTLLFGCYSVNIPINSCLQWRFEAQTLYMANTHITCNFLAAAAAAAWTPVCFDGSMLISCCTSGCASQKERIA